MPSELTLGRRAAALAVTVLLTSTGPLAAESVVLQVAPSLTVTAELTQPDGDGPFPAVVMLHGCSGPWKPWGDLWSGRLVRWGYVVLQVDSFGPRGYPEGICDRPGAVAATARAEDAHVAKGYLQGLPFVDPDRIGVLGMSHGGWSALWAVQNSYLVETPRSDPFKAAATLYPYCEEALYRLDAPLLILIGELDDWTPASRCEGMTVDDPAGQGAALEVYPQATHVFDVDLPERTYLGHSLQHHPEAADDAEARIKAFLAEHLR